MCIRVGGSGVGGRGGLSVKVLSQLATRHNSTTVASSQDQGRLRMEGITQGLKTFLFTLETTRSASHMAKWRSGTVRYVGHYEIYSLTPGR